MGRKAKYSQWEDGNGKTVEKNLTGEEAMRGKGRMKEEREIGFRGEKELKEKEGSCHSLPSTNPGKRAGREWKEGGDQNFDLKRLKGDVKKEGGRGRFTLNCITP